MPDAVPAVVKQVLEESHIPADQLVRLLASIRLDKRSGLLQVYFNQGSPNGTIKFLERQK